MASHNPLILVDGSSYLFRAYYALPPLTNSKGQPTGAIYGVINMLKKLVTDYPSQHVAVIFDPKGKTFRNDLYSEYKANRAEMPDDLREQIKPLFDVIKALGFPLVIEDGYEADDVIATLAKQATKQGLKVVVSTGDKDLAQIVNDDVTLINTMTNRSLDPVGVKEKFGVPPDRIIDYLTLIGDSSDNIPGVSKVGPKTAVKWLDAYGSLENIVKHANEIKGKVGENLRACLDTLPLTEELVTVVDDIKLAQQPKELVRGEQDRQALIDLFSDLEFKSWLTELLNDGSPTPEQDHYTTIVDKKVFAQWLKKLASAKAFAFDTETTSLDAIQADLVGLSFAVKSGEAAYVPVMHDYSDAPQQLDKQWVLAQLQPLLQDKKKIVIGQNLKYDFAIMACQGVTIQAQLADTMLQSYVLNSSGSRHDLNTLALRYLGRVPIKFEDVAGKGAKQITFNQVSIDKAAPYAAEDADLALQLHHKLMPELKAQTALLEVYQTIDMPLIPILANMEMRGVLIDAGMLKKQSQSLAKRIDELEQEAYKIAGHEFNLGSPKQLQTVLFDELKIPIAKKTPGGQPSTAENVLQDLALDYPMPNVILEYRSLSKLKSTYTDRLPEQINPETKRVHTSYNQAVTSTGRLSSNNPNLQNIPVRTEEGRKIRDAFIAPKGYKIVAADYSQVELRIIAHISQDPGLIKAFERGLDIHRATAAEVFGVQLGDVDELQRRRAKAINFGLLYGMSAFGLSKQLGVERHIAQEYMDIYFHRYPKVRDYMQEIRELAAKQGYVETLFGRRVYLPDINATHAMRRKAAERAAINAPMQGSAADIIKLAMIKVDQWLQQSEVDGHMIMQVHDELIFEILEQNVDDAIFAVKTAMENSANLSVPLLVSVGVGDNWDEAH